MNREQLAWAAGFIDGEGCFSNSSVRRGIRREYPALSISQRNPEVLFRFLDIFKLGHVRGPIPARRGNPYYFYRVNGLEQVQAVGAMVWAFLSPVKRKQFSMMMEKYKAVMITR